MTKEIILNMLSKGGVSIDSITLADYSEYDSDKCNNGGCYIYYETYTQTDSCSWVKLIVLQPDLISIIVSAVAIFIQDLSVIIVMVSSSMYRLAILLRSLKTMEWMKNIL